MYIGIYKTLMTILFPIIRHTYIKKRQKIGKEPHNRFNERLGEYTHQRPEGKLYWFHGASVGESISMLPLINKLLEEDENLSIMVTTGTITSAEIMQKNLPERCFHQFIPFDVPKFSKKLLNHFKPDVVLWFESELWPSMLSEIHKRNIPLILVNGRVSDKSYESWKKFSPIIKEILSNFTLLLGQSWQDATRLEFLSQKKAHCFGNIKFAGSPLKVEKEKRDEIMNMIKDRPVFFISSTHDNEEEQLASNLYLLFEHFKNILIINAPRHPNRGEEIEKMYQNKGFITARRSKNEPITNETAIYIADTIGEMGIWYDIAPLTFVGGSLIPHGGQNISEPARSKSAVIVGPNMQNFTEMMQRARNKDAVIEVSFAAEVIERAIKFYSEPETLEIAAQKAYDWAISENKVLDDIAIAIKKELKHENP